jgi:C-terminal processing protease CtpA/Prc
VNRVTPQQYVQDALHILEENSINRASLNWDSIRSETEALAESASSCEQTYAAIRRAIQMLGDNHSFLLPPDFDPGAVSREQFGPPSGRIIEDRVGFVALPFFMGTPEEALDYAEALHHMLRKFEAAGVERWIVDLRQDGGGNMGPMLAGLGPLLSGPKIGAFSYPDGTSDTWNYQDGGLVCGSDEYIRLSNPVQLQSDQLPVAVLTGPSTASSGEAVTVAFRGRPLTRSFGQPTYGVSTCNRGFDLPDGGKIWLTVGTFADRTGSKYGGPIKPDKIIEGSEQEVLTSALEWVRSL